MKIKSKERKNKFGTVSTTCKYRHDALSIAVLLLCLHFFRILPANQLVAPVLQAEARKRQLRTPLLTQVRRYRNLHLSHLTPRFSALPIPERNRIARKFLPLLHAHEQGLPQQSKLVKTENDETITIAGGVTQSMHVTHVYNAQLAYEGEGQHETRHGTATIENRSEASKNNPACCYTRVAGHTPLGQTEIWITSGVNTLRIAVFMLFLLGESFHYTDTTANVLVLFNVYR